MNGLCYAEFILDFVKAYIKFMNYAQEVIAKYFLNFTITSSQIFYMRL